MDDNDTRIRMIVRCGFASGYTKEYIKNELLKHTHNNSPNMDSIIDEVFCGDQKQTETDLLTVAYLTKEDYES